MRVYSKVWYATTAQVLLSPLGACGPWAISGTRLVNSCLWRDMVTGRGIEQEDHATGAWAMSKAMNAVSYGECIVGTRCSFYFRKAHYTIQLFI